MAADVNIFGGASMGTCKVTDKVGQVRKGLFGKWQQARENTS